jgi:hypothetical protein
MHAYMIVWSVLKKLQSTRGKWLTEIPLPFPHPDCSEKLQSMRGKWLAEILPPFPHSQIPQFIYGISPTLHLMMGFPKDHALQCILHLEVGLVPAPKSLAVMISLVILMMVCQPLHMNMIPYPVLTFS